MAPALLIAAAASKIAAVAFELLIGQPSDDRKRALESLRDVKFEGSRASSHRDTHTHTHTHTHGGRRARTFRSFHRQRI
eukprot:2750511-Prymnesium_polylepis.1